MKNIHISYGKSLYVVYVLNVSHLRRQLKCNLKDLYICVLVDYDLDILYTGYKCLTPLRQLEVNF